jgi:hypothetical protein
MNRMIALLVGTLVLGIGSMCWAADAHAAPAHSDTAHKIDPHAAPAHLPFPHPTLPAPSTLWPAPVLIVIAAMFLSAAVIGPIVRSEIPEEVALPHSHDEPPGASGHHGHSGMVQPAPEHGHH